MSLKTVLHFVITLLSSMHCRRNRLESYNIAMLRFFGLFKRALKIFLSEAMNVHNTPPRLRFLTPIMGGVYSLFTCADIITSFRKSGLWPVDRHQLMDVPRPRDASTAHELLAVNKLEDLYVQHRTGTRPSILGKDVEISRCRFVDTTWGAALTSDRALELAKEKADADTASRTAAACKEFEKEISMLEHTMQLEGSRWAMRTKLVLGRAPSTIEVSIFRSAIRPLSTRREVARERSPARRDAEAAADFLFLTSSSNTLVWYRVQNRVHFSAFWIYRGGKLHLRLPFAWIRVLEWRSHCRNPWALRFVKVYGFSFEISRELDSARGFKTVRNLGHDTFTVISSRIKIER